jgi:hypothetical protein
MQTAIKFATTAALAFAMASAPVAAQDRSGGRNHGQGHYEGGYGGRGYGSADFGRGYRRNNGNLGAALVGVGIIAGIAAIASSHRDRPVYRSGNGYGRNYGAAAPNGNYGNNGYANPYDSGYADVGQDAVDLCTQAALETVGARGVDARISQITGVDGISGGARIGGLLDIRGADDGYRRGYSNDAGYARDQRVRFSCTARYGRIVDLRIG